MPPVRSLGPVLAVSTEPMAAVSQVRSLPGGRLIVNDNTGRRLLMFDSTLTSVSVIADTIAGSPQAYGSIRGGLIAYRADSTLFVDPALLSMLAIDPTGKIVRTRAVPDAREVNFLIGGPYGTPGLDPQGRLVYKARVGGPGKIIPPQVPGQPPPPDVPDSGMVVRFNLETRAVDTVGKFVVPSFVTHMNRSPEGWTTITNVINPIPWTDDWAMLSDGRVAIVHGQEYRVDIFDANGKLATSLKVPFDWQRLSDADKTAIVDSARTAFEIANAAKAAEDAANARSDSARLGARSLATPETGANRGAATVGRRAMFTSSVTQYVAINEMPDYRPPFRLAAARGDEDGNLWIRTSNMVNGGAVYDVINGRGVLVDRVQVPPGRVIAGFGPGGIVYMGVLDGTVARLERARAH
jgi:hypothetical protein